MSDLPDRTFANSTFAPRPHRVLVIGGGFSGTLLAAQLLLRSRIPLCVTIVDRGTSPGRGVAYGTFRKEHVLNVKASEMSALADDPAHFVRWLQEAGLSAGPEDFVPRQTYGDYVAALFNQAQHVSEHASAYWVTGHAASLRMDSGIVRLQLEDGTSLDGDVAVLAIGNAPPALHEPLERVHKQFVARYAWSEEALAGIPEFGAVLIIGSGLTAIDQVLALRAERFQGKITLLSRRGVLPAVHGDSHASWPGQWTQSLPADLRSLTRCVRREIRLAHAQGGDWRAVLDSLRPRTSRIWQLLSLKERKRFLRHLKSWWEVSRHRISPQTDLMLQKLKTRGQLTVIAGTLLGAEQHGMHVDVSFRVRGTEIISTLPADRIINCIGPGYVPRSQDKLIEQMLTEHLARLDPVGLGIETRADGSLVSAPGETMERIFAIGPVRKACLWETTAVREIRVQAVELADSILETLAGSEAASSRESMNT